MAATQVSSASLIGLVTPRRRRGVEHLERPDVPDALVRRSLADVSRANALFGGRRAAECEVIEVLRSTGAREATVLDVGTGLGDIPASLRRAGSRHGIEIRTLGVDSNEALVRAATSNELKVVRADAMALPFPDASVDVVLCSQVLHHFEGADAVRLLREMTRVARIRVIVADIRRSWLAAAGIWLASFPLGFHPVSRHDGVLSVLRGFTGAELVDIVRESTGASPRVRARAGFRITASWTPPV